MNPGIDYYRAFGTQAYAFVRILKVPTDGHVLTINGTTFTFGTDYWGDSQNEIAQSLAAAINGERTRYRESTNHLAPSRAFFAYYAGFFVILMASVPGTAGNSLTLATSAALEVAISGATFTGGLAGIPLTFEGSVTASGELPAIADMTIRTPTVLSRTMTGAAIPMAASTTKFLRADMVSRAGNANMTWGTAAAQPFTIVATVWYAVPSATSVAGDLNLLYVNGTAGNILDILYWS